jgi:hypothetical protein
VLPVTGFSPGVGNFGAMSKKRESGRRLYSLVDDDDDALTVSLQLILDREAMVEHKFAGSWKPHVPQPEDE